MTNRYFISFIFLVCFQLLTFAQPGPPGQAGKPPAGKMPSIGRIYGKVMNAKTKETIPFVFAFMTFP